MRKFLALAPRRVGPGWLDRPGTGRWEDRLIFEGSIGIARIREIWQPRGSDTLVTAMEFEQAGRWTLSSEAVLVRER